MTKQRILCGVLIATVALLGAVAMAAAGDKPTATLTVVISDFPSSGGFAMVALSNSAEAYAEGTGAAYAKMKGPVVKGTAKVVFFKVPYGDYAISLYHDQNSNGQMDKNALGIPKEPYAFSNNATAMFGKPDWDDVRFTVKSPKQEIKITLDK